MPDAPPDQGKLIQVTRDVPAPNPKFIVDDSPLKASIITILSLAFFGITLAGAILRLASAHDLNGIRALLFRDDTIGWLTTVAPFAWAAWRAVRSWTKKLRDSEIVDSAKDAVAMTKSKFQAAVAAAASPPSRAPETTTATRLVDAAVLHRGGLAPATADPEPVPAEPEHLLSTFDEHPAVPGSTTTLVSDVLVPGPVTIERRPVSDTAPRIPGDVLGAPLTPEKDA